MSLLDSHSLAIRRKGLRRGCADDIFPVCSQPDMRDHDIQSDHGSERCGGTSRHTNWSAVWGRLPVGLVPQLTWRAIHNVKPSPENERLYRKISAKDAGIQALAKSIEQ